MINTATIFWQLYLNDVAQLKGWKCILKEGGVRRQKGKFRVITNLLSLPMHGKLKDSVWGIKKVILKVFEWRGEVNCYPALMLIKFPKSVLGYNYDNKRFLSFSRVSIGIIIAFTLKQPLQWPSLLHQDNTAKSKRHNSWTFSKQRQKEIFDCPFFKSVLGPNNLTQ